MLYILAFELHSCQPQGFKINMFFEAINQRLWYYYRIFLLKKALTFWKENRLLVAIYLLKIKHIYLYSVNNMKKSYFLLGILAEQLCKNFFLISFTFLWKMKITSLVFLVVVIKCFSAQCMCTQTSKANEFHVWEQKQKLPSTLSRSWV